MHQGASHKNGVSMRSRSQGRKLMALPRPFKFPADVLVILTAEWVLILSEHVSGMCDIGS